ncbi:MAG: AtpZ/AtpI family protein [Candidatus Protochlamydia sp.]|nr:AtpZ/AtpI family protein [Candidatus Protochlamydia sp.]
MPPDIDPDKETKERWKQAGVFITIPFVIAVSPILGWLIGNWLDKKLNTHPYLMYFGLIMGFAAGFRELYRIIKRFGNGA